MDYAKESLRLHAEWKGKIEVIATVPVKSKDDLSLAYTPGVAQPCLEIQKDINKSYDLTRRANMCLVVTDGSAVLGLGDIGPEAGMPVMEGKCVLFKSFGGVDAFPLCVKTKDVDEFVNAPVEDDDDDADEEKSVKLGAVARFRQAVMQLPQSVRLLIITPLWALGTAIMTSITFLWNILFASPLGAFIASFASPSLRRIIFPFSCKLFTILIPFICPP